MSRGKSLASKANLQYFKPTIENHHNKVYKWLIDEGYTVNYLATVLGLQINQVNPIFRTIYKLNIKQITIIIKLLEKSHSADAVLNSLFMLDTVKLSNPIDLYNSIQLPDVGNVQVYRSDYEPKQPK